MSEEVTLIEAVKKLYLEYGNVLAYLEEHLPLIQNKLLEIDSKLAAINSRLSHIEGIAKDERELLITPQYQAVTLGASVNQKTFKFRTKEPKSGVKLFGSPSIATKDVESGKSTVLE